MEAQPHEGIHSKASPNVPRPDPTTATRSKGLGRFRDMGMGVEKETLSPKAPNYHQTGQSDAVGILWDFPLCHGTVEGSCKGFRLDYDERED